MTTRVGETVIYIITASDAVVFNVRSGNPALQVSEGFECPAVVTGFNSDGAANLALLTGFPPDSVATGILFGGFVVLYLAGINHGTTPGTWQKV